MARENRRRALLRPQKEVFGGGRRFSLIRIDERAEGRCRHPLDEIIGLSPRCRVAEEMRLTVLRAASQMPYSKAAARASPLAPISKSTVARIIADIGVSAVEKPVEKGGKVHVQIDEKYIKMDGKARKTRYDIDTSEMSYGMRKLFSQIKYGVL